MPSQPSERWIVHPETYAELVELGVVREPVVTEQAQSSAPTVRLLRILERCWKERAALPDDLVERIREQLEGPLGLRAKADERVLEALGALSDWELENGPWRREPVVALELERRRIAR